VNEEHWKTGQLISRARGLTRQQLYFYQVMGLVEPAGQTPSGRWLYDEGALGRLDEIAALRSQGKTLRQVRDQIAGRQTTADGDTAPRATPA